MSISTLSKLIYSFLEVFALDVWHIFVRHKKIFSLDTRSKVVTCNKSLKEYGHGREKYCPRFSLRNLPLFKDSHIFKRQKQFGSFSIVEFRFEVLGTRKYYYARMRALYSAFIFLNKIMCEGKEICKPIHHS